MEKIALESKRITVVGLGYVGLPLAIEFSKYYPVVGFDIDAKRVNELKAGIDKTGEFEREELSKVSDLIFTSDVAKIENSNIYLVTVPTPVDSGKRPNLNPLRDASKSIGRFLKPGDVVVYESTVYPGATEDVCVPILEAKSGLKCLLSDENNDPSGFFVGYSPERINPGDETKRITDIVKVTSGSTPKSAAFIDNLYREVITAGTHLAPSIKVAEAAKVIENAQRDINIAFINELSMIFAGLGIPTSDVLEAAETKWNFLPFKPGLVGGHCVGVDPYYLTYKANMVGHLAQVILAGRRINDEMAQHVAQRLTKEIVNNGGALSGARVGVLGITFKENCSDTRNSKVFDMINELHSWGVETVVWDPQANHKDVLDRFGIEMLSTEHFKELDAIVVAVGHVEIKELSLRKMKSWMGSAAFPILLDMQSIMNKKKAESIGFKVLRL